MIVTQLENVIMSVKSQESFIISLTSLESCIMSVLSLENVIMCVTSVCSRMLADLGQKVQVHPDSTTHQDIVKDIADRLKAEVGAGAPRLHVQMHPDSTTHQDIVKDIADRLKAEVGAGAPNSALWLQSEGVTVGTDAPRFHDLKLEMLWDITD